MTDTTTGAALAAPQPDSIARHAARCFGEGLAGRAEATRRGYREAWGRFATYLAESLGLDAQTARLDALPPNVLAHFYRWCLGRSLAPRTAEQSASAVSVFLQELAADGLLPPTLSYERLRLGLRRVRVRGDYERRRVDPRLDAFLAWVTAQPLPEPGDRTELPVLRQRALILTLYSSGIRRAEAGGLRVVDVLEAPVPGEVELRGKGGRTRLVFLGPAALAAIRQYVEARGPADRRPWLFVSHGNRHHADHRLAPRTIWAIVKEAARQAEQADARFDGLAAALHTHDLRHHFARTILNRSGNLSVVQELLGHASPSTTARVYVTNDRATLRAAVAAYAPGAA